MEKAIYFLSSCTTCQRILGLLQPPDHFRLQDIKKDRITPAQLEQLKEKAGSYEALFSRRAMLYKSMNLKEKALTEADFRDLILEHYTFLKRPVIVVDDEIFIGSSAKVVAAAQAAIKK